MAFDPGKAVASKVSLLVGNDAEARKAAVESLLRAAGLQEDDMDLESIIADSRSVAEWIGAACMVPFLADRRAVIVRNVLRIDFRKTHPEVKLDKNHPLVRNFAELPDSALLVLVADEEIKEEDNRGKPTPQETAWVKLMGLVGGTVHRFDVPKDNLEKHVRERATALGKKLSPRAAKLLLEMTANKLGAAHAELEKLALYVGDHPEIREEDLKAVVTPDHEYNVFRLVEAVTAGQVVPALTLLRTLFGKIDKISDEAFGRLFPPLHRQFRLLWQARACIEAGCTPAAPNPQAARAFPKSPNLAGEKDWLQGKLMNAARPLSFAKLQTCLEILQDADAKLKGQRPATNNPYETIEQAIITLTQTCKR